MEIAHGPNGLERLRAGRSASEALEELVAGDGGREVRQVGIVDADGRAAAFTGDGVLLRAREDVGRHNAVDKIAGWMFQERVPPQDKIFYTTGRLTSEMVIKAAQMGIPFLVSRSGLTQMGYEIAQKVGITMLGRATGKHFLLFTGGERFRADA